MFRAFGGQGGGAFAKLGAVRLVLLAGPVAFGGQGMVAGGQGSGAFGECGL